MKAQDVDIASDAQLKGYLVIYVDGYKVYDKYLVHMFSENGKSFSVPDRFVPPPSHEVGSMHWWLEGWAVGDNARGRLCMRNGAKPLRRFRDYDEAVAYAYARRKKHPNYQHVLVYVTTGVGGKERMEVVRSRDDIDAVEARIAGEIAQNDAAIARHRDKTNAEHPHLKALQEKYGMSAGWNLSYLVKDIREKGIAVVKASISASTFRRKINMLRDAGVTL